MTIAERLRMEKYNAAEFDLAYFMEKVTEYFEKHSLDASIELMTVSEEFINRYRRNFTNGIEVSFDPQPEGCSIDRIILPVARLDDVLTRLREEGFYLYRRPGDTYRVGLISTDVISYGYSDWYRVN